MKNNKERTVRSSVVTESPAIRSYGLKQPSSMERTQHQELRTTAPTVSHTTAIRAIFHSLNQ